MLTSWLAPNVMKTSDGIGYSDSYHEMKRRDATDGNSTRFTYGFYLETSRR